MYKVNFKDRIFESTGEVKSTRVQIQEEMTTITRVLKGDLGSENDDKLIELVLEQFYQETYPNRAENERFEKMDALIKDSNKALETTRQTLAQTLVKDFENDALFEDISAKFEFLANHLGVELPTANPDEGEDDEKGTEGTEKPTENGTEKPTEPPKSEDLGGNEDAKNEG
ncbi:DUF1366 domain-containing protein [Gemella morbillorum]|uniref:DUF1366 domain-containing protein n=1 Tax=Gemella morbillorum TaxID=29391 RepID=UPI00248E9058|nr:DUF1366 domain-containing protein [Gemella morbillorum]